MANAVYTQFKDRGAKTGGQVIRVPIEFVEEGPNVRTEFDHDHIVDLAKSIKLFGQEEPGHGYYNDGKVILTRGANRRRAILLMRELFPENPVLTMDILPCEKKEGAALAVEQYTENNKRKPLSPMDSARAFGQMRDEGWTLEQISESTGETPAFISQRLALLNAPAPIQEAVELRAISPSAAAVVSRTAPEKRERTIKKIAAGEKVTVAEAQEAHSGFAAQVSGKKLDEVRKRCHALIKKIRDENEFEDRTICVSDMIDFGFRVCQCIASAEMSVDELFEGIE